MDHIFGKADLSHFVPLRAQLEKSIRAEVPEHVILQVHDALYAPLKRALSPIRDAIEDAVAETVGGHAAPSPRRRRQTAVAELRRLLDNKPKERELQDALISSGLLDLTCTAITEVAMEASKNHPGMRMDLVTSSHFYDAAQIIELKRGSHLLVARQGKPTERLSRGLRRAVKQLDGYGDRLASDLNAVADIKRRHGMKIERPELRLVAGRRLPAAGEYHLLSLLERHATGTQLQLQIYTWDGLLAELERIAG